MKRTIAGVVEYLIYDGPQIVQRYDTSDTLQGWVVWGANADEPLIDYTPAAGKHYYHSDVQGNTITVTDASLNTLERYRYDAYGNVTFWAWSGAQRPQSTAGTKYLFTGQEYVPALGLHNYKNRMYASEIGRFLQSDPKRLDGGDFNLYRYCRNNPFNLTDPDGQVVIIPILAAVVGGAINAYQNYDALQSGKITKAEYALSIATGAGYGALATMAPGVGSDHTWWCHLCCQFRNERRDKGRRDQ